MFFFSNLNGCNLFYLFLLRFSQHFSFISEKWIPLYVVQCDRLKRELYMRGCGEFVKRIPVTC